MIRKISFAAVLCAAIIWNGPAFAWSEHALGAYPALGALPEIADAADVRAERFEDFVRAEQAGLADLLKNEERWARENLEAYGPLPAEFEFKPGPPGESDADLRRRLLQALRVHPEIRLRNYVQLLPGRSCAKRPRMSHTKVSVYSEEHSASLARLRFCALGPGEAVSPLEVAATAIDEPDFGHDINLWEDSPSEFGPRYNFGALPFGDPKLYYATQAPFHMGFYHESGVLFAVAGFLKRTYPDYRARLYASLARFAFETGHDYWGYRFMGWGLHYITDLTQPYHSTVVPGLSTAYMLWINLIAQLGFTGAKEEAIQLVSNRHTALEEFQMQMMHRAYREQLEDPGKEANPVIAAATKVERDASVPAYDDNYIRDVLSAQAYAQADMIDEALSAYMPPEFVNDPDYRFSASQRDEVYEQVAKNRADAVKKMNQALI
ncbi:MAG: hypothetical protein RIF32_09510, partial [Leptospirales bacterium]